MKPTRLYLYGLFNNKKTTWFVIFIATLSKSVFTALFSSYEGDKSFYLLLAKSLGSGHGFNIPVTLLSNPSVTEYVYLPSAVSPLYSLIAAPLLKIFPENYFLVTWLIESLSWLLMFLVLHKILLLLLKERFWPNLFILFSGFFLYNLELTSSSKDILATALLFCGVLRCLQINKSSKQKSFLYLAGSSLLFILPGLTKYTFIPLAPLFPVSLIFIAFLSKQKQLLRSGIICLIATIVLVIAHYLFFHQLDLNDMHRHEAFYFNRWSLAKNGNEFIEGFYPQNLLLLYPYFPASLFNIEFAGIQVRNYLNALYRPYAIFLSLINVAGIVSLAGIFIYLSKKYYRRLISSKISFLIIGSIISFSILLLTCIWSLRFKAIEYKGGVSAWTYVFENRPYFFSILFIQLLLVAFVFAKNFQSFLLKKLRSLLIIVMILGALHGFYFLIKSMTHPRERSVTINKLVTAVADSIQKARPSYKVWIATEIQHLDWYAKLKNHTVLNYVYYLNDSSFTLPAKTIQLTAINKDDSSRIQTYLHTPGLTLFRNYDDNWLLYLQQND